MSTDPEEIAKWLGVRVSSSPVASTAATRAGSDSAAGRPSARGAEPVFDDLASPAARITGPAGRS
ncbi:hypothetical protein [Streptomyces cyaneofuscatus]|uniref:hypothetical protein n=1 Tax=Streptomyces cyaneofuscatus TaxID=66883 RepID=UPI0036DB4EAD